MQTYLSHIHAFAPNYTLRSHVKVYSVVHVYRAFASKFKRSRGQVFGSSQMDLTSNAN